MASYLEDILDREYQEEYERTTEEARSGVKMTPLLRSKLVRYRERGAYENWHRVADAEAMCDPEESSLNMAGPGALLSQVSIANGLVEQSYISCETALSWYGIMKDPTPGVIKSMSLYRASCVIESGAETYEYKRIPREAYHIGVLQFPASGTGVYRIASPEKALCDLVRSKSGLNLRTNLAANRFLKHLPGMNWKMMHQISPALFHDCIMSWSKKRGDLLRLEDYLRQMDYYGKARK